MALTEEREDVELWTALVDPADRTRCVVAAEREEFLELARERGFRVARVWMADPSRDEVVARIRADLDRIRFLPTRTEAMREIVGHHLAWEIHRTPYLFEHLLAREGARAGVTFHAVRRPLRGGPLGFVSALRMRRARWIDVARDGRSDPALPPGWRPDEVIPPSSRRGGIRLSRLLGDDPIDDEA